MRLIDLNLYLQTRKKETLYLATFFSIPVAVILFLLLISGGFFEALLFGILIGGAIFGFIYGGRSLVNKGIDRKRNKLVENNPYVDVKFRGEIGALVICEDRLIYRKLTPGGEQKDFEMMIDENLYLRTAQVEFTGFQSMRMRDIKMGAVVVKEMPHGIPAQFEFYDVDGSLERVMNRIEEVNKFVHE